MAEQALNLNDFMDLAYFRGASSGLTMEQAQFAVGQALFLFDELYAHLPLKEAMHAVNPVQRLRLLMQSLQRMQRMSSNLNEGEFYQEMIAIFNSVRDLHTNFILPEPFTGTTAFLPFTIEEYFENGIPHYPVTHVVPGLNIPSFVPGVEATYWNGIPMRVAVAVNAASLAGSNAAAQHLQGLRNLTVRPLMTAPLPLEDWVTLTYVHQGGVSEARFPWKVFRSRPKPNAVNSSNRNSFAATTLGLDLPQERVHQAREQLFAPEGIRREQEMLSRSTLALARPAVTVSDDMSQNYTTFPNELSWGRMRTTSGTFGYLRIRSFNIEDVDGFVNEVIRILALIPHEGLILDVRSNPGGNILAGERLLQLFTSRTIQPEPMEFRNSLYTLQYAQIPFLQQWSASIDLSVQTGAIFSQGFTLDTVENVNRIGQRYPGRVVLLTDAACYSTTDIFAAGFQDNEIGPVLGVDDTTGAGGANVWTYELLRQFVPSGPNQPSTLPLPNGMDMRIAFRRSTRVGRRIGLPLEDLGVQSDIRHQITRRDIFNENADLMEHAGGVLAGLTQQG
jgi:hypothetical protein